MGAAVTSVDRSNDQRPNYPIAEHFRFSVSSLPFQADEGVEALHLYS